MASTWNLGSLVSQMRAEFGARDQADVTSFMVNKINQAIAWICRRRDNWPFLRRELTIEIPDQTLVTYAATRGSRTVNLTSVPSVRDIFVPSYTQGDAVSGYLIASVVGSTATLQSNYRGTTTSVLGSPDSPSGALQQGFFELPADATRLESISRTDNLLLDGGMDYKTPIEFDTIKKTQLPISLARSIYTVKKDPLNVSDRFFLSIYPYASTMTTLQGNYSIAPPELTVNSDVPIIPVNNRECVFYFACWFYAQSRGIETAQGYQLQAMQELQTMLTKPEFVDEENNAQTFSHEAGDYIVGPSNYPEFE